jgi:hypothetical protein
LFTTPAVEIMVQYTLDYVTSLGLTSYGYNVKLKTQNTIYVYSRKMS